jgi:ribonuclease HI
MAKLTTGRAVGVVCRSGSGEFLGASSLTIQGISDHAVIEALACREALALAQDLQLQQITVASDCLSVINALEQPYASSFSMILEEVKADASMMSKASFSHENRASNSEARRLARFSVSGGVGRQVWLMQPPDGLYIKNNIYD